MEALGEKLAGETGQPFNGAATGEYVAGTCRQRFALASGSFLGRPSSLPFDIDNLGIDEVADVGERAGSVPVAGRCGRRRVRST